MNFVLICLSFPFLFRRSEAVSGFGLDGVVKEGEYFLEHAHLVNC